MLILCDFDGTLSQPDVTNLIWDRYGLPRWREVLLPPYRAGTLSPVDLMIQGYRAVRVPEAELLDFIRPKVHLRDGFEAFHASIRERGWTFCVVSCGLDWYLRALLPPDVPYYGLDAAFRDGRWDVRVPERIALRPGEDFKVKVLETLRPRHPGAPSVFIGDGRNDLALARVANRAFAVRGSNLAGLCAETGMPCTEFASFAEVAAALG